MSGREGYAHRQGSYRAEVLASTIAAKFLYDLCKIEVEALHCRPDCEMIFDSLTVGRQAEGKWKAAKAIEECHVVRSIMRLCESRFGVQIRHTFCPSHQGEPGNELVDQLAYAAALGFPLQDWQPFFGEVQKHSFVKVIEWAWILFEELPGVHMESTQLIFPAKPSTVPPKDIMPTPEAVPGTTWNVEVSLCVATCNVLTLQASGGNEDTRPVGVAGPARQEWIVSMLEAQGVNIFALQETRVRVVRRQTDPRYHLICSAATMQGHFGIMVGLSRTRPHGWKEGKPITFGEDDFRIIAAQPRFLVLSLRSQAIKCILIAAHAPHTGATLEEIETFWHNVSDQIPNRFDKWPRLMLADANCRVGGHPDGRIGEWQSEGMHEKSQPFADFLAIHNLFLPSTFDTCHYGPGGTWMHHDGTWKRNDYIGLDCTLPLRKCQTWIPEDVDFSLQKEDHRPLFALVEWEDEFEGIQCRRAETKLQTSDIDAGKLQGTFQSHCHSFHLDVHSHAWNLQEQVVACRSNRRKAVHRPRKLSISPPTWELIKQKQKWRLALANHQDIQNRIRLATFFAGWRFARCGGIPFEQLYEFDKLNANQDAFIAFGLHQFRTLGKQVTQSLRQDDAEFFRHLASEASDFMQPHQVRDFWRVLRRSLPRFRDRKLGHDPNKLEILQEQWVPYFEQLESGTACDSQQIVQRCHARQMAMPVIQDCFRPDDIPSIIEFEDALRTTQAERATGLDPIPSGVFRQNATQLATIYFPLLLKICMWQHEPVTSKGGQMAVIHKRGLHLQAENYRGIMLLPSIAKRVHALIRTRLMNLLSRQRPLRAEWRISCYAGAVWIPTFANLWACDGFFAVFLGCGLH